MLINCGDFARREMWGWLSALRLLMRAHPGFVRTTDGIGALCEAVRVKLLTNILFAVMAGEVVGEMVGRGMW